MFLSRYVKESPEGEYRAEIHQTSNGYSIEYYGPNGIKMKTEDFSGKSIHFVKEAAENWVNGIKILNG
jgi:hypothetical protein